MKTLYKHQSDLIRKQREKLGYSQYKVADLLDLQIRQYQRIEYGERSIAKINMKLGLSLCRVLEIDPFLLVFGEHWQEYPLQIFSSSLPPLLSPSDQSNPSEDDTDLTFHDPPL